MTTITSTTDTSLDLNRLPNGAMYALRWASVWDEDDDAATCVGGIVTAIAGPLDSSLAATLDALPYADAAEWLREHDRQEKWPFSWSTSQPELDWANAQDWLNVASTV